MTAGGDPALRELQELRGDEPPATSERYVGRRVRRLEDPPLLQGRGRFVDDDQPRDALHVAFVRSTIAHGRIVEIDTTEAVADEEVVAVLTAEDIDPVCQSWRGVLNWPGMTAGEQRPLARGKVVHVGEPVAMVVATSRARAEDAADRVFVSYEELPATLDPERALAEGAVLIHEDLASNRCLEMSFGEGDVEAAFAAADVVVEVVMQTGRHTAMAIEPRGIVASFDQPDRRLTVRVSTQASSMLQTLYARLLGLPENAVRILTDDVGGAFGMKAFVYPDEMAVVTASVILGRPLKWIQDRYEAFQSDTHARDERVTAALALRHDGTIVGLRSDVLSDCGAYSMYPRSSVTEGVQVCTIMPGPYRVPCYDGHLRVVFTNKSPLAVYRAVGHPVAILVMESLMDAAAAKLGLSREDVRRRNLLLPEEMPYRSITGNLYDSGSHLESFERLVELLDLDSFEQRRQDASARGRLLGIGMACFVEISAPGAMFYGAKGAPITAHDQVEVRMEPDGSVTVCLGTPGQGQGLHTTAAQVAADRLGIDISQVRVISGDTRTSPHGTGVWASRSAVVSTGAVHKAAGEVRRRLIMAAAHLMEANDQDLEITAGRINVRGGGTAGVSVAEVAERLHWRTHELPDDLDLGLAVVSEGRGPDMVFNNGAHAAIVEVDPDTGAVSLVDYIVVEDCGVLINPDIVDGQIRGGVAQGVGGALFEELVFDQNGQPQTSTLLDYLVPTAADLPAIQIHHIETPSPLTVLGSKGVGEAGTAGAPAAIHAAVNQALAPSGACVWRQPITPERVLGALEAASQARRTTIPS